jgi:hypothetical protein
MCNLCDTLLQTFGEPESAKHLLSHMNPRRISSPQDLINHIRISPQPRKHRTPGEPIPEPAEPVPALAQLFFSKFIRYICGNGHPFHHMLPDAVITPERRELVNNDPVFRAENFLMLTTGSELLPPPTTEWEIQVRILMLSGNQQEL